MGGMNNGRGPREGVSVLVPAFNEEESIGRLLEALEAQTLRPAEIVVADGGSADRTPEIVRAFAARSSVPVVLLEGGRGLPGRNRNLALARASREWAACVDAGTVPRADWLERLVEAAEREADARVVYGQYKPLTDDFFTRCSAVVYLPPPGEVVRSTASLLMHRAAWEAAGPFREDLRSAEDLLFFRALDAAGVPSAYARDAFVEWELKRTAAETFRKFTAYSRNNLRAGLAREWHYGVARFYAVLLAAFGAGLFFRPALIAVPLLLVARAARRVRRWHPRAAALFNLSRLLMVIWLNLVIDAATFSGTFQWLVRDRAVVPEGKNGG